MAEADGTLDIMPHLTDLNALAKGDLIGSGISAKDTVVSIENLCRKLLDEQAVGAASMLFNKSSGLIAAIWTSIQRKERDHASLIELRHVIPESLPPS